MTFNTQSTLWDSPAARKAYPRLTVTDNGDVVTLAGDVVARFCDQSSAKTCLRLAGWHFSGPHGWTDAAQTLASQA